MTDKYYSSVRENFKRWAPFYDAFCFPFGAARAAVVAALAPQRGEKILDICTGTGAVALELAKAGAAVTGVDLSEDMLEKARRKRGAETIRFLRMNAADLMFRPDEFDAATISFALHEMPQEITHRVLQEAHRVTKHRLVVIDYVLPEFPLLSSMYRLIVGLYEGPFFADFLKLDLQPLAREDGLQLEERRRALFGTCQILIFRLIK